MVDTIKFSEFANGGDLANDETTVGLEGGVNTRFNNPWTFLKPGPTGDRPPPATTMYYRLRFNTTLEIYEYYDPTIPLWVELSGSGTGTVNPGVANDIAFYAASGQAISPIAGAANSVLVSNSSEVPSMSTTLPVGLSIPGAVITSSTAALTAGSVIAAPVSGNDITNKTYVDSLVGGTVLSITGTTNQVIASSPTGNVTLSLPQDIAVGSTPTFAGLTLSSIPLGASSGGTGVNNGSSTITLGGSILTAGAHTLAGAFASTFNFTGVTNVTFPTSGTLSTTTGTVTSVSGTANRITSTGGATPVIDIAATYVGQTSITTLGTIGTGTWQGTLVSPIYGGTGVNNGASTLTLGGSLTTVGAFASTFTMTGITGVTFPTSGTLATTSQIPTGAALTKTDDTNVTLTLGGSPSTALVNAASLTLGWAGTLAVVRGGTGVSSVTTSPTATAFAGWDANSNLSTHNLLAGFSTTPTAAGTTTLTVASNYIQEFTGSTTQTVTLPVTSTLAVGQSFFIINNSSGNVTVNSSGGNAVQVMAANTTMLVTCVLTSGTTAASWNGSYFFDSGGGGVTSITGTANQVIASASTGAITLSLPQDIATTSIPTFTNVNEGYTTTATAAGTTTLTVTSNHYQYFTGSTTQTVVMPVTSTLVLGQSWFIANNSTGIVTVQSSGANTIATLPANSAIIITCILTSGTTAASWSYFYAGNNSTTTIITPWVSYVPTLTGFGTPSSTAVWSRRVGDNLEVRGVFVSGTSTATEARMTLGFNGTNNNITSSNTAAASLNLGAAGAFNTAGALSGYVIWEQNKQYVCFGFQSLSAAAMTKQNGSAFLLSGQGFYFNFSVAVDTWP